MRSQTFVLRNWGNTLQQNERIHRTDSTDFVVIKTILKQTVLRFLFRIL